MKTSCQFDADMDRWCIMPSHCSCQCCFTSVIKCCLSCYHSNDISLTYQRRARQHCCPLPRSAETHPGLHGQTCPSNPSAPTCPRSPPWRTCFLLALDTKRDREILASHGTNAFTRRQQGAESRKRCALHFRFSSKMCQAQANGHVEAGWYLKWVQRTVHRTIQSTATNNGLTRETVYEGDKQHWRCH